MKTFTNNRSTQSRPHSNNGRTDNRRSEQPRDSSRSNVRVNPREMHQKYLTLGKEAATSGNHVEAEKFYQHAEHYYRVSTEHIVSPVVERPAAPRQEAAPQAPVVEQISERIAPPRAESFAPRTAPAEQAFVPRPAAIPTERVVIPAERIVRPRPPRPVAPVESPERTVIPAERIPRAPRVPRAITQAPVEPVAEQLPLFDLDR